MAQQKEKANESAALAMLMARQRAEDEAAALLADLARCSAEVEQDRLLARRLAISKAMKTYEDQTSGIHRLYTTRNSESTEARAVLQAVIQAGTSLQNLVKLDALASYLMTLTDRPTEYPTLRPLRDASRLKRLLKEHYDAAP